MGKNTTRFSPLLPAAARVGYAGVVGNHRRTSQLRVDSGAPPDLLLAQSNSQRLSLLGLKYPPDKQYLEAFSPDFSHRCPAITGSD
jgi:hypothetical protein